MIDQNDAQKVLDHMGYRIILQQVGGYKAFCDKSGLYLTHTIYSTIEDLLADLIPRNIKIAKAKQWKE